MVQLDDTVAMPPKRKLSSCIEHDWYACDDHHQHIVGYHSLFHTLEGFELQGIALSDMLLYITINCTKK